MSQLIHSDCLQVANPVASYWEATAAPQTIAAPPLAREERCDVAIVGGGFTGLSAALELAQQGISVRLLEAGPIGWGASGRNGGFACIGSHKLSYATMMRRYGHDATRAYYSTMKAAIDLVAETLTRHDIDGWKHGSGEIQLAHLPGRMEEFKSEQDELLNLFGDHTELLTREDLQREGLAASGVYGGLRGRHGFGLHPLNYVRGLARAAQSAGAMLHAASAMTRWEQRDGRHHLYTEHGILVADRVLVATNGYTPEHLSPHHAGRILPVLSSIIVTRPLTRDEQNAQGWWSSTMAYDSRNLLHYFRLLPNGCFLFGGRGGTDSADAAAAGLRQDLVASFHKMFPAWKDVAITHSWRGHVCLAYDRVPYLGALDDRKSVWTALAYHGNGVAMASWSGQAVARMMTGRPHHAPAVITRRLAKFPLPALRPLYLRGAYLWYGWKDSR